MIRPDAIIITSSDEVGPRSPNTISQIQAMHRARLFKSVLDDFAKRGLIKGHHDD